MAGLTKAQKLAKAKKELAVSKGTLPKEYPTSKDEAFSLDDIKTEEVIVLKENVLSITPEGLTKLLDDIIENRAVEPLPIKSEVQSVKEDVECALYAIFFIATEITHPTAASRSAWPVWQTPAQTHR